MLATIIFLIILLILYFFRTKKIVKENGAILSFALTTVATLIGVVLAVNLSQTKEAEKEKEDIIKILNTGVYALKNHKEFIEKYIEFNNLTKDSVKSYYIVDPSKFGVSNVIASQYKKLRKINLLKDYLKDNTFKKNISENTIKSFYATENILESIDKDLMQKSPFIYGLTLDKIILIIETEILYQKGKISLKELNKKILDTEYNYEKKLMKKMQQQTKKMLDSLKK